MPTRPPATIVPPRARLSGACFACVLLMGVPLSARAQTASQVPSPDASFDLPPPASVPPQAPVELQPAAPAPAAPGLADEASTVRFGVLCLTRVEECSQSIVVLETVQGWWVEDKVLELVGGAPELRARTIDKTTWRLVPVDHASWNEEAQKLVWDRPLPARESQDIYSARGDALPPVRSGSIPALALHYSATLDESGNATVGTQAVASRGHTAVFLGGVQAQGHFIRDLWRVEHDDVDRRLRYVAGEQIIRPSDPLGGSERIRGIAIERAYDIDPSLATTARPGLHGIIEQPGVIDIYSNGRLVSSTPIQPGPYQWGNIPLGSGSQQIELVFRGADGSRSVLSNSFFYGSNRALAKGLTDFSVRAGRPYGASQTRDMAWQGWVRHGTTSHLTLGGRIEGQGQRNNAGVDASIGFGVGSVDAAYARDNTGSAAWSVTASLARNGFDAQVGRSKLAPDYWFLGREAQVISGSSRVVDERFASMGYGAGGFSLRSSFSQRAAIDGSHTRTASLMGTWRSSRDWRWFASVDRTWLPDASPYQASVGVAIPLGRKRTNEVEVRALVSDQGQGGQVSWNRHHQEIYGWSANASLFDLPSGERGMVGGYEQATPVGTLLTSAVKTNVQSFAQVSWSGTLIRADDNWFASSPEQGPRALVRSSEPQAVILRDNQPMGTAGKRGRVVSGLAPYSPVSIQVDASSLSLAADTSQLNKTLITPRTGVVAVSFDTTANGQVEGELTIDGQPARLGVLSLEDGRAGWVGESGRLWIEGGTAGKFKATWTDGSQTRECSVVIGGQPLSVTQASCP